MQRDFHQGQEIPYIASRLTRLRDGSPLLIYLSVTDRAMSSVLIQEIDKAEKPVYFVNKVFRGAEARYQKIEKLALSVVIVERKLRPYFQG